MSKTNGLFITGTDTGVGKTRVTAILALALRQRGLRVGVMKLAEIGCLVENFAAIMAVLSVSPTKSYGTSKGVGSIIPEYTELAREPVD